MLNLDQIINKTKTFYCLECGKCTGLCPVSRHDPGFSPRVLLEKALLGFESELTCDRNLFSCLTCYACSSKCPADVDFPAFVREARAMARDKGQCIECAHSGVLQSMTRLMAFPRVSQRRLEWLSDGLRVNENSDTMYFVGCAPYFKHVFDFETGALDIATATVKILNACEIEPLVHPDEKCCGHDLFWTGEIETFKMLAEHNARIIKEAGVKRVVFSCAEGYSIFKRAYPEYVEMDCEILHISEVLAHKIGDGELVLDGTETKVTYQDSCRLGQHAGVYDAPRKVIAAIPGTKLVEMEHNRDNSICCGTSAFANCGACSRAIRVSRLSEARATGAETLVTGCPKCQIHFRCAMTMKGEEKGPEVNIKIKDLTCLVADALGDAT